MCIIVSILLLDNPNYYAGRTVFGGAPILPVNQTAKEWAEKLHGQVRKFGEIVGVFFSFCLFVCLLWFVFRVLNW
jgi:hypothetical protein